MRTATPTSPQGFTLVELLVVVTIIVILVAMLVPAMSKAVSAAQLVVCQASNLRTIASVSTTYAYDNKKWYPNNRPEKYNWDAYFLQNRDYNFDLRKLFRPYVPVPDLAIFADPLAGGITFEDDTNRPGIDIYANYHVFSGWGIAGKPPAKDDYVGQTQAGLDGWRGWKKMNRIGDGFEFTETRNGANVDYRFPILASDWDSNWGPHYTLTSHPDSTGKFLFTRWQNEIPTSQQNLFTPFFGGRYVTQSYWEGQGYGTSRVLNFAYDDGSVTRYDNVESEDDRMAKVVETSMAEYEGGRYTQLPKTH